MRQLNDYLIMAESVMGPTVMLHSSSGITGVPFLRFALAFFLIRF